MRTKRLLAGGLLAAALGTTAIAVGQSRPPKARPGARPKAAASSAPDNPYGDNGGAPAPAPSATAVSAPGPAAPASPPAAASDQGPVPPPASDLTDAGIKLSPLNPAPNEFSDAGAAPPSIDYDRLLADIGSLRARVAAVSDTLFHSRIAISLENSGEHARVASMSVSLDDGVVWTSPAAFRADDETVVYDHAVAPGHHAVAVDVERRDDRNDAFRSAQRSRFVVDVPADNRLAVQIKLWDDSNVGNEFPADKSGQYELRVRARVKAEGLPR
jgi:hypothetical protein